MKSIHINALLMIITLVATSCGADAYIKKGEKNLALGEYFDAANNFKQAYIYQAGVLLRQDER